MDKENILDEHAINGFLDDIYFSLNDNKTDLNIEYLADDLKWVYVGQLSKDDIYDLAESLLNVANMMFHEEPSPGQGYKHGKNGTLIPIA